MAIPRGVRFNQFEGQAVDHQVFPEEFFSGSDVTVYFGDVWLDDLTSISFEMMEQIQPISGYASYTWDAIARGSRIIQGHFSIAFREAGYLNNLVLDHIAQLKDAKPALAWLMDENRKADAEGNYVPKWQARARERVEDLISRFHSPSSTKIETREDIPTWADITPDGTNSAKDIQDMAGRLHRKLDAEGASYYPQYDPNRTVWFYDEAMQAGVVELQADTPQMTDESGHISKDTRMLLAEGKEVTVTIYDTSKSRAGTKPNPSQAAKTRLGKYEAEVWGMAGSEYQTRRGEAIPLRVMRRFRPYWYSGASDPETNKAGTEVLAQKGFDIYFSFGAMDAYLNEKHGASPYGVRPGNAEPNRPAPGDITFPTTVRALRNVQIMGMGLALDASGRPVEEIYRFMAQDLD